MVGKNTPPFIHCLKSIFVFAQQLKVPKSEPKKTVKFQLPNNAAGGKFVYSV